MHYFLGSNTPTGFFGYYNQVNKEGNRLFILKRGSGVGKHTFMKTIAKKMEKKGLKVDYCHCSNDVNSLDGILISDIGVCIIDGTAPHMADPKAPGCFDEIIDLGKYIDRQKVLAFKSRIEEIAFKKKKRYERAYTYLKCAKEINEDSRLLTSYCINEKKLNDLLLSIPQSLIKEGRGGMEKSIFSSAYTSCGYVDYTGTLKENKRSIGIKGSYEPVKRVVQAIYNRGKLLKTNMTVCKSPLNPFEADHILTDNLNIFSIDEHNKFSDVDEIISIEDIIDKNRLLDYQEAIEMDNAFFDKLIKAATAIMYSCKVLHEELESIYTPAVDFDGVNEERERVLKEIKKYVL